MLLATPLGTAAAYALFRIRSPSRQSRVRVPDYADDRAVILIAIGTFYAYGRMGMNNTTSPAWSLRIPPLPPRW